MLSRLALNLHKATIHKHTTLFRFIPIRCVTYLDRSIIPIPAPCDDNPERDYVNFPRPVRSDYCPPVRFLFVPEHFFTKLYPKLGVTGPYTFFTFSFLMLISKEYFLLHHHSVWLLVGWIWWIYVAYVTPLAEIAFDVLHRDVQRGWEETIKTFEDLPKDLEDMIEHEKKEQWRAKGEQMVFAVKRDNIAMQLEAAYRERAMRAYNQVKRRLDYQVEVTNVVGRVHQKFLVDWVINKVMASITPEQEKESLKKCISDLQLLAAKASSA